MNSAAKMNGWRRSQSTSAPLCDRAARPGHTLSVVTLLLLVAFSCLAVAERATQSQVEAAYLFNFGKFVTWPADRLTSSNQFEICILGKDPFGGVIDATVNGESIGGKKIQVRRLAGMREAASCSILFVSSSEEKHLNVILAAAQNLSLLTVSNIEHFAERGGIIGLVTEEDKIRFEVNRDVARKSRLVLSSELMKVAIRVIDNNIPAQ